MFEFLKEKINSFTKKVSENLPEKEDKTYYQVEEPVSGEKKSPLEKISEIRGETKKDVKAKVGIGEKIKGFVTGQIELKEKDLEDFLFEFELSLLESDVEQDTASEILKEIMEDLIGKKVSSKEDLTRHLKAKIGGILQELMKTEGIDLLARISTKKPYVILFLGPNGAGKTTSLAKLTHWLQKQGKSVVLAACDTFRAASIEQLSSHAEKLGVKVVKHDYGADPAAVAFDAVKSAKSKGIDVVLIDSAGRQDTNRNLMEQLKKIVRVVEPDLKLYVGESFTGQALLQQITEFNEAIGLDGFVLTKIDTDTKGGTAISLLYKLKKPILFIGTGQTYNDFIEFKTDYIISRIID